MNIKVAFICLVALLTSCAAALLAGAAGGLIVYDKRPVTIIEQDARIAYNLQKSIVNEPNLRGARIAVTSFNQIVLLTGQTAATSQRIVVEKMANKTPHVRRVYNQITIQHPITYSEIGNDTWITSQVRTKMLAKKGLASGSLRVVTENSIVYLMGVVTRQQAALATEAARQVPGVQRVVQIFQYVA